MAVPPDRTYFPTLEECLKGERVLLSWNLVASALSDASCDRLTCPVVSQFLQDAFVLGLVKSPSKAFEGPTAQSKSDFETKTAAINVTPTPNGKYDITVIKEDALWLSRTVSVSEVTALRVVVVEFQSRAQSHLTSPLSTQDVVNIQEAAGASKNQATSILASIDVSATVDAEAFWSASSNDESRRQRILLTYLTERRCFMMSADYITSFILHAVRPRTRMSADLDALRAGLLSSAYGVQSGSTLDPHSLMPLLSTYLDIIPECITRFYSGVESVVKQSEYISEFIEVESARTCLTEATHAMTVVFQILDISSHVFAAGSIASRWFRFVDEYQFLDRLPTGPEAPESISELSLPLQCLVCAISLAIVDLDNSIAFFDPEVEAGDKESPAFLNSEALGIVHKAILQERNLDLVAATPVIFSWTLIVHRMHLSYQERDERRDLIQNQRAQAGFELKGQPHTGLVRRSSAGSIVSIEPSHYDRFLAETVWPSPQQQSIEAVEKFAIFVTSSGQVYDFISSLGICSGVGQRGAFRPSIGSRIRMVLLNFLKASFPMVGYQSEPVTSLSAVLSGGQSYWDLTKDCLATSDEAVVALALADPLLLQYYVRQALARYPLEFMPFATLCRILSTCLCTDDRSDVVIKSLLGTPSLAFDLPQHAQYALVDEAENAGNMQITQDLPLFSPLSSWKRRLPDEKPVFIPSGSRGRILIDGASLVNIEYEHSTVGLLGKRLDVNLEADSYDAVLGFLGPAETAEAIALLATLIRAETLKPSKVTDGLQAGLAILQEASRELAHNKDIVTVVCDTVDTFIQDDLASSEGPIMAVLSACVEFLHAVLPICPGRIWSFMARSQLLNTESRAGRLSRLTGAAEMASERLSILSSSIRFLSSLVDSAMSSAVQRKVGVKFGGRQKDNENPWLGISDKILGQVCLSVAQTAIDIFENTSTWKFSSELDRATVICDVVRILNNVVTNTYSLANPEGPGSLTECLKLAARYIIDSFLSSSSASLRFQPLLASLMASFSLPDSTLYLRRTEVLSARLTVVLEFATTLLRAAHYLGKTSTVLETQLFKVTSLLARLCAVRDSYMTPALALLDALVVSAGMGMNEPPSLFGYLGPQISKSFLQILSNLDKPFQRPTRAVSIWKFFSTILRNRQQWMANCLLSGKPPREALKSDSKITRLSSNSVFGAAKETLRSISFISSSEALAVLDFFTSAQNYWPWTIFAIQSESDFLDSLREYARTLKPASVTTKSDPLLACNQARIAAYLAETFAMQLYHLRQMGKEEIFARDVIRDLDYFLRDGVEVSGYNTSLHVNFQRNFANRYAGCSLDDFKRTLLSPKDLGVQYYYALDFAETMLCFDTAWAGSRDNGFRNEMQTANLNLSLVDAQIALFQAWEFLLLELSVCLLPKNQRIQPTMVQVIEQCLTANQTIQGPEQIFVKITQARANLALTLIQRLADCSMLPKDISSLLTAIWTTVDAVKNPFSQEQIQYYRTLLKTLYVILRGSHHSDISPEVARVFKVGISQIVLDILNRVVAEGFRTLVTLIHDPDITVHPEDLALITAILQACLSTPGMDQFQTEILNMMSSHDVLRVATSLFSWSDKLADKGDPIYGELSLLFLLELSSFPLIAEQLACDGLLGHLTSANLATHMRRQSVSPFADSVGAQRCYSIWAKAVLPLLLNILIALKATIAPEIVFVLRQFPNLLESSVQRFETPGLSRTVSRDTRHYINLLAISEIHSVAILTRVLAALRMNNNRDIPEVTWDAGPLLENVEFWLSRPKLLRERLVPLGQREAEWRNMKPQVEGSQAENRLEEKAVALLEAVKMVLSEGLE